MGVKFLTIHHSHNPSWDYQIPFFPQTGGYEMILHFYLFVFSQWITDCWTVDFTFLWPFMCPSVNCSFLSLAHFSYLYHQQLLTRVSLFFFPFIFIIWKLITLQYCSGFLSYINMNQPWIYMYSPSWSPLPPPSPPVPLFLSPWTDAHRAPLPMGFSRQEYWSGLRLFLFFLTDFLSC